MQFSSSLKPKLIYIFQINDEDHKGCLKAGETTADTDNIFGLEPNSSVLNQSAKNRINQYTQTAGISYDLLYTEVAIYIKDKTLQGFNDKEVHQVLERSGIKKKTFDTKNKANEWFVTDLETVKNAIKAVKEGRQSLLTNQITTEKTPISFRPEQAEAIEKTKKQFKKSNEMLWFAKMRFGKTLSALQVIKDLDFSKTLILTHRPVVDSGWFEDFGKIFYDKPDFIYGSKNKGSAHNSLENLSIKESKKYVYFASMQDLRGSSQVGGNFDKNNQLFATKWDFIIIDEAHEGTQTELGQNVIRELKKEDTKILHLSGTPFNLLDNYKEEEIFTWDYVMEQKAKTSWDTLHFGDSNPYASLPRLNIFTYDLGNILNNFKDEEVAFNFREFFRVNEGGAFIHEKDVTSFLDLICKKDEQTHYPYSTEEYRQNFRHTLWMVPGVKEAKALSSLLQTHSVFSQFKIVNVAGDGDEEVANEESLKKVENAIGKNPDETYTITISCGRLTTGVSVPAWTAVLMLSGSFNTSASTYMQTIFRVQTPANINGKIKEECFVFDFAPDRTLKVIAETAKISSKAGKTSNDDRKVIGEFLNFCPVIGIQGGQMRKYDVNAMLEQLKKVYVERVISNGFEDTYLYDNDQLMKLGEVELQEFDDLREIIGKTKAQAKTNEVDINKQGFTDEQYQQLEDIEKKLKAKKELTLEEQRLFEEKEKNKKTRDTAVSILRGISIRMPLLIYGADITDEDKELDINNFTSLVDEKSWSEFMPKGITKDTFKKFKKYYEPDVFRAAGKRIRAMAKAADKLSIEERISRITNIFANFRNPDKETVLTPWRVVNMHIGDTMGGWVFFDEKMEKVLASPRFVDHGDVTAEVFDKDATILEINSKSGLYPLYMAYSIYKNIIKNEYLDKDLIPSTENELEIWDKIIANNIFVLCKTPMAKSITKRTLSGFRDTRANNIKFLELLSETTFKGKKATKIDPESFNKVKSGSFWNNNINDDNMKFTAIVGNPPYQEDTGGSGRQAKPIYQNFIEIAKDLEPRFIDIVIPARWYTAGMGLDDFRDKMLNDQRISKIFDYENCNDIFPRVDIAGGLCYFLWDKNHNKNCEIISNRNGTRTVSERSLNEFKILVRDSNAISILRKIFKSDMYINGNLSDVVSSIGPFGLPTNYHPNSKGIPCFFIQKIGLSYANKKDVIDKFKTLDKYKILIPKAPIAGQTDFSKPIKFYHNKNTLLALPGQCCTDSWIVAGAFDSEQEALSFKTYLFTKIARFLILQTTMSQDVNKRNFIFVPDLKDYNKIYTDKYLIEKWGLSDKEWEYINSRILDTDAVKID